MMTLGLRFALATGVMTALLLGMIANKQFTVMTGTSVVLETEPVDPRSLFRGDYVRLRYRISDVRRLPGDALQQAGAPVYVLLRRGEPAWTPVAAYRQRPERVGADEVVIRGAVDASRAWWSAPVDVKYGIENYYVPEGEGLELESRSIGKVTVEVAVDRFGRAGIRAILIDGVPKYVESLL